MVTLGNGSLSLNPLFACSQFGLNLDVQREEMFVLYNSGSIEDELHSNLIQLFK